jgi:hypothetical protein
LYHKLSFSFRIAIVFLASHRMNWIFDGATKFEKKSTSNYFACPNNQINT